LTGREQINPPDWMTSADTARLFGTLSDAGASVRFVGGCVRDAVLGRSVKDLDVATDAEPNRVLEILGEQMIRAVPTGIEHGTVTAIPDARPFQITTLRRDVATDGRRATVEYTNDWVEDSRRRDFTFNALSADIDGMVYDYTDGITDLNEGRVRFIGKATDRITEDQLRILRFYRFQAHYGKTDPDPDAVAACSANLGSIQALSGERIWNEFSRTLIAPEPSQVFELMEKSGLLRLLLPVRKSVSRLTALAALETMVKLDPDPVRRLTALVQPDRSEASQIATRLRLSKEETRRFDDLSARCGETSAGMNDVALRRSLYTLGPERFRELVLLDWANQIVMEPARAAEATAAWKETWDKAASSPPPEFPLNGEDVKASGIEEGPDVGEILKDIEEWWVEQAFRPDREDCVDRLRVIVRRR
jgi:poly(A) polymerase